MTVVAFEDARFVPVRPDRPEGPRIAVLWGDPGTGPSAMLLKLKKGPIPAHVHSNDYHLAVLQGTMKHWGEGETEATARPLGPGSYWFQPGNAIHWEACVTDECLLHIVWSGRQDARLASDSHPSARSRPSLDGGPSHHP